MKQIRSILAAALSMTLLCSCSGSSSVPVQIPEKVTGTFEDNPYFEITDTAMFRSSVSSGGNPVTVVVYRLHATEDIDIDSTLTAYAANGERLDESREFTTPLVKDEDNYLAFQFETAEPIAETKGTFEAFNMLERGPVHSVEMVQWMKNENGLTVALEQTANRTGPLTRGRFLLSSGGRIIGYARSWFMKEYVQKKGDTAEIPEDDWSEYCCEDGASPDKVELFLNP